MERNQPGEAGERSFRGDEQIPRSGATCPNTAHVTHVSFVCSGLPQWTPRPRPGETAPRASCQLSPMKQPGGAGPWLSLETVGPGQGRQPRAGWDLELAGDQAEAKLPVAAVPARLPLVSSLASGASWQPLPLITSGGQGDCPGAAQSPGPHGGPERLGPRLPGRRRRG